MQESRIRAACLERAAVEIERAAVAGCGRVTHAQSVQGAADQVDDTHPGGGMADAQSIGHAHARVGQGTAAKIQSARALFADDE